MLGDDLFKRRVAGKVVTIKCRHCPAEIEIDGTHDEPTTKPSNEAPAPPRPPPPRREGAVALSPGFLSLREGAPQPPGEQAGKAPPIPRRPKTPDAPPVKPPSPPLRGKDTLVDLGLAPAPESEPPPSSGSGTPSLAALTHETSARTSATPKKSQSDDFLMNLHAPDNGMLAAPTIDISNLGMEPPPPVAPVAAKPAAPAALGPAAPAAPKRAAPAPPKQAGSLAPAQIDVPIDADELRPVAAKGADPRLALTAPAIRVSTPAAPEPKGGSRAGIVLGILLAAALGAAAVIHFRPSPPRVATTQPDAPREPPAIQALPRPPEPEPPPAAPATPEPVATDTAPAGALAPPASTAAPASAAARPSEPATGSATDKLPAPAVDKPASTDKAPAKAAPERAPAAEKPAPAPAAEKPAPAEPAAEFDRSAAVAALKAAAAEAATCRKEGDPSGTASVTVTFAPSGRVTSATLSGPPFAGTATGGCIAAAMRRAKVPPFGGDRVTVGKTIVIQ